MTDILLNSSGDIDMSAGSPQLVRGIDLVAQRIHIRLRFFLAEWPYDITAGFPFFQAVFVAGPNLSYIRGKIADTIKATPGVLEVQEVTLDVDRQARTATCTFKATTTFGPLAVNALSLV
jgi:hypothetical protein